MAPESCGLERSHSRRRNRHGLSGRSCKLVFRHFHDSNAIGEGLDLRLRIENVEEIGLIADFSGEGGSQCLDAFRLEWHKALLNSVRYAGLDTLHPVHIGSCHRGTGKCELCVHDCRLLRNFRAPVRHRSIYFLVAGQEHCSCRHQYR